MQEIDLPAESTFQGFPPSVFSVSPPSDDTIKEVQDPSDEILSFPKPKTKSFKFPIRLKPLTSDLPPLRAFGDSDFLSPAFQHKGVRVVVGDVAYEFATVQDDPGMDCGFAIDERKLKISPNLRYATQSCTFLQGSAQVTKDCTVAVCEIEIEEPKLKIYTIVNGLHGKEQPLVGRFMVQDAVQRVYAGALSTPSSGGPTPGTFQNVGVIPEWSELRTRFQTSEKGKKLRSLVNARAEAGTEAFKNKRYEEALASFQWVSVFGFFTHSHDEQYFILKNLASGYEQYFKQEKQLDGLAIALLWAKEAHKIQDTPLVRGQIARLEAAIQKQ